MKSFLDHRNMVLGYLRSLVRDTAVAEEIFQELALVILEEDRRETQVQHFQAWVRKVARHRAIDYFDRQKRDRLVQPLDENWVATIEQAFAENEWTVEEVQLRKDLLRQCLKSLGGRVRQMVDLRYCGEMTLAQIAAQMDWQVESIKVALSRARRALYDCVKAKLRLHESNLM